MKQNIKIISSLKFTDKQMLIVNGTNIYISFYTHFFFVNSYCHLIEVILDTFICCRYQPEHILCKPFTSPRVHALGQIQELCTRNEIVYRTVRATPIFLVYHQIICKLLFVNFSLRKFEEDSWKYVCNPDETGIHRRMHHIPLLQSRLNASHKSKNYTSIQYYN